MQKALVCGHAGRTAKIVRAGPLAHWREAAHDRGGDLAASGQALDEARRRLAAQQRSVVGESERACANQGYTRIEAAVLFRSCSGR